MVYKWVIKSSNMEVALRHCIYCLNNAMYINVYIFYIRQWDVKGYYYYFYINVYFQPNYGRPFREREIEKKKKKKGMFGLCSILEANEACFEAKGRNLRLGIVDFRSRTSVIYRCCSRVFSPLHSTTLLPFLTIILYVAWILWWFDK